MSPLREVICAGCRSAFTRDEWAALSIVNTLTRRELELYVLAWEDARVIEVRACATCGRCIARATARAA
jgi:hypothetical protein